MAKGTDQVGALQQLATELLVDVERIAEHSVRRMKALLPAYAAVPTEELLPVALTNIRNVLEAVLDPRADPGRAGDHFRLSGQPRVRQGMAVDAVLLAWRIGVESVRGEARAVADRLRIPDHALLAFVEATLQWGDLGMRISAQVHREGEIYELERLAVEQAALRRVAELVAREASQTDIFTAIAEEARQLLGADEMRMIRYEIDREAVVLALAGRRDFFPVGSRWSLEEDTVALRVFLTGRPARIDDYQAKGGPIAQAMRSGDIRGVVGAPILVQGELWGAMLTATVTDEPLPPDTGSRLGQFTELMATAIANAEARAEVSRLADEQAALRRVATLVAQGVPSGELFSAVAREVGTLLRADYAGVIRYEPDPGFVTRLAAWAAVDEPAPAPARSPTVPGDPNALVADTGKPVRLDDLANVPGPAAEFARRGLGIKASVVSPIVVDDSLWGVLSVHSKRGPLPPDAQSRLLNFAELVATAIANVQAREEVRRLTDRQAALRRVATLVAQGAEPSDVFDTVAAELAGLLQADHVVVCRYEPGSELTALAYRGSSRGVPEGMRINHEGDSVEAVVRHTGRSARVEYEGARGPIAELARAAGVQVAVGAPVVVDGRLWGVAAVGWSRGQLLPADTEERMVKFAELLATTISNVAAREEVQWLAQEQAALRRVATMVARGSSAEDIFAEVAAEVARLLGFASAAIFRYEPSGHATVVGVWGELRDEFSVGGRWTLDGDSVVARVYRTERPARGDRHEDGHASGSMAGVAHEKGVRSAVGTPVVVNGRLWGAIGATTSLGGRLPTGAESQIAQFAELVATTIANADGRAQLTASRARLVTEADEARRQVVRDLHDGAQQGLVHTIVALKHAQRALHATENEKAESLLAEALERAQHSNAELRELAHGILPAVLTQGGLRSGVATIVSRLDLPVEVGIPAVRFPTEIEASAYFVVAEALTNVVKHSRAGRAEVKTFVDDGMLHVEVRDDGVGGVDPHGHGLVGIADRVSALGGRLEVQSPAGGGTLLSATLPLSSG